MNIIGNGKKSNHQGVTNVLTLYNDLTITQLVVYNGDIEAKKNFDMKRSFFRYDDPRFIDYAIENLQGLLNNKKSSSLCELYHNSKLIHENPRLKKFPFFIKWLSMMIEDFTWKKLDFVLEEIFDKDRSLIPCLDEDGFKFKYSKKILKRYTKKRTIENTLTIMKSDPDFLLMKKYGQIIPKIEKKTNKFKNLSPEMIDYLFRKLNDKKYFDQTALKRKLKELFIVNKFIGKIIDDLRKAGGTLKIRNLEKKHNKNKLELRPYLRYLKNKKLAFLKNGILSLNSYDPKNNRKFMWLVDSGYWTFGPQLEKGKIYNSNDFIHQDVIKEWVKQGAARYI